MNARPTDRLRLDAAHLLGEALGGQPIVVEAERVQDVFALHAVVADHHVGLGVGVHVADVDAAGHGGRRRIDRVHRAADGGIELVDPVRRPLLLQARLGGAKVVAAFQSWHGGILALVRDVVTFATVDEYIAAQSRLVQTRLGELRAAVLAACPRPTRSSATAFRPSSCAA